MVVFGSDAFCVVSYNRLKREASATMYVVGALAFAFVEEWNGYPLGSFLFALFVAARECVWSSLFSCNARLRSIRSLSAAMSVRRGASAA